MLVQMLVGLQEGIVSISVNTVSGSILIEYKDISLETVISYVKALDGKYLNDENLLSSVSGIVPKNIFQYCNWLSINKS